MLEVQNQQSENQETLEISQEQIDSLIENAKATFHKWRQRGPWMICTSCANQHSSYIGVAVDLIGIDEEGKPILKKRAR